MIEGFGGKVPQTPSETPWKMGAENGGVLHEETSILKKLLLWFGDYQGCGEFYRFRCLYVLTYNTNFTMIWYMVTDLGESGPIFWNLLFYYV